MLNDPMFVQLVWPIGFVGGALLLGWLVELVIVRRLARLAARTSWQFDDVLVAALRGMVVVWIVAAGAAAALAVMNLSPEVALLARRAIETVVVVSLTITAGRILVGLIDASIKRVNGNLPSSSLVPALAWALVWLLGGLVVIQNTFGIAITPLLTTLGIGGLAVALALQDTLANLFAGFYVIIARKIRLGDYIKLDSNEEGYVVDISWRNTTIRVLANNLVVVPNARLASAIVTNYNLPDSETAVLVNLGVGYESDLTHVERVTIEVAREVMRETPGGVPEFEPFIRYNAFADHSVNFTVIMRAKQIVDQFLLTHEFIKRLHARYGQEQIAIPFPIRTLRIQQGEGGAGRSMLDMLESDAGDGSA